MYSRHSSNCKTGHFASWRERKRQRNVQKRKLHVKSVQKYIVFIVEDDHRDHRRRGCLSSLVKELLACSELFAHDPNSSPGLSSFLSW